MQKNKMIYGIQPSKCAIIYMERTLSNSMLIAAWPDKVKTMRCKLMTAQSNLLAKRIYKKGEHGISLENMLRYLSMHH